MKNAGMNRPKDKITFPDRKKTKADFEAQRKAEHERKVREAFDALDVLLNTCGGSPHCDVDRPRDWWDAWNNFYRAEFNFQNPELAKILSGWQ